MERISFEEAKRLSLIKWNYIIDKCDGLSAYNGDCPYPEELKTIINDCGFCERYLNLNMALCVDCKLCEMNKESICNCYIMDKNPDKYLYMKWYEANYHQNRKEALKYAIQIRDIIQNVQSIHE